MAKDDDEAARPRPKFEIGQTLDLMSVAEIDATIATLRAEIARLEAARAAKAAASVAAESLFRK